MPNYYKMIEQLFALDGALSQTLDDYTYRNEQVRFAGKVAEAFQDDLFLCAEAGTGVGKTYAYLIPALLWALQNHEKVVVSTKTKALQEQIVDRDIPQLEQGIGFPFRYIEAKGRENYLCWNKYQRILGGKKSLDKGQIDFVQKILTWAESTQNGDRKELGLPRDIMRHWEVVAADRNSCLREKCQYHDKCFRLKLIKGMAKADIIVVNHALLLSDILVDYRILPEYKRLIIDEAHTFIKETFDRFAYRFEKGDSLKLLTSLYSHDRRIKKGILPHVLSTYPQFSDHVNTCIQLVQQITQATSKIFDEFSQTLAGIECTSLSHVINPADREEDWFANGLETYNQTWRPAMALLIRYLKELSQDIEGETESIDLNEIYNVLQEVDNVLFTILSEEIHRESAITWLECSQGQAVAICSGEVERGSLLANKLYKELKTLVMVSATLAVEDNFDNFITRAGLMERAGQGKVVTHLETSPFNYNKQACLYILQDMPDPGGKSFGHAVNSVLAEIFASRGGRTMVLFTSRQQLQEASAILRPFCEQRGINLLVQHEDGDFANIRDDFTSSENSILMGVETFWEGVDLKGEVLCCLVIVKLPFRSPTDPYCSAWEQYYRSKHKNSFRHFMLPDAALRFKQGIGRLIRSETDRGAVVVLDTRLVSRNYGHLFIESTPIRNIALISRDLLANELERWC